jgi:maltose-binding protein MalE
MEMQRSLVLFAMVAVVALFAVTSMPASQQASAHHKAHTASSQVSTTVVVHHKAHTASSQVSTTVVVQHKAHTASKGKISVHQVADPQVHGIPLLNATALKKELTKEVKGPYGESDVIGGMMSGGY